MLVAAFTWTEFAQQIAAGVREGAIYAGLALALVIIYRSTRVINFAQGEMATFTTFVAWSLMNHGLSFWTAFPLVLLLAFAGGVAIERVVIRPVENAPVIVIVIVTLGLALLLNGLMSMIWGGGNRQFHGPFSTRTIDVGGVPISVQDIGIVVVSLALVVLLGLFFRFTKLGLAMRAAAQNPESSRLTGIRVSWTIALGWGLATALGAVAGLMAAPPLGSFDQNFMQPILLYAFAGAVLGGIDSALGAVIGSLALGIFLNLIGTYVSWVGTDLRQAAALAVILGVLLVRPAGLFGKVVARRV
jgi:branched-chain amino acid transport system permease protein